MDPREIGGLIAERMENLGDFDAMVAAMDKDGVDSSKHGYLQQRQDVLYVEMQRILHEISQMNSGYNHQQLIDMVLGVSN